MNISELLCSSPSSGESNQVETSADVLQQGSIKPLETKRANREDTSPPTAFVPDNQRKRPYRLSATRKRCRREHEEFESRVFNLTLDINALRQEVQYLLECRDLYLTQSFVFRQRVAGDVVAIVAKLMDDLNGDGASVMANELSCYFPRECTKIRDLVLGRGTHVFSHRRWTAKSVHVVTFVKECEDETSSQVAEIRRLCGDSDGCVAEAKGVFTGRIKREMLASFYPHVLSNEGLMSRLIGVSVTASIRLVLYFNDRRCITHQVAQIDVVKAMDALRRAKPRDFAELTGKTVSHEF